VLCVSNAENDAYTTYGGDTGQLLLAFPDVPVGYLLQVPSSETAANPLRNSSLCGASYASNRTTDKSFGPVNQWPVQDTVCVLRPKVAKNFQLTGYLEI
jgi:hypothetical protein